MKNPIRKDHKNMMTKVIDQIVLIIVKKKSKDLDHRDLNRLRITIVSVEVEANHKDHTTAKVKVAVEV